MISYHHVQYQKKTNDPILRKFSDGWTNGWKDRQTDESDFIGCCPTNVEHPKDKKLRNYSKIKNWMKVLLEKKTLHFNKKATLFLVWQRGTWIIKKGMWSRIPHPLTPPPHLNRGFLGHFWLKLRKTVFSKRAISDEASNPGHFIFLK